jgi:hypothetical protein
MACHCRFQTGVGATAGQRLYVIFPVAGTGTGREPGRRAGMLSLEFPRQLAQSVFPRRERAGSDCDRDDARDQGSDGDAGGEVCSKSIGTPISYAYAVKAGPWIFLTGHEAFDFESGIPTRWLVRRARCLGGGAADARAISFCSECGARSSGPTWATASASRHGCGNRLRSSCAGFDGTSCSGGTGRSLTDRM